jgi:hypothetical protein
MLFDPERAIAGCAIGDIAKSAITGKLDFNSYCGCMTLAAEIEEEEAKATAASTAGKLTLKDLEDYEKAVKTCYSACEQHAMLARPEVPFKDTAWISRCSTKCSTSMRGKNPQLEAFFL